MVMTRSKPDHLSPLNRNGRYPWLMPGPEREQLAFALELKHQPQCASGHDEECDCDPRAALELLDGSTPPEEPVDSAVDFEHPPREIFFEEEKSAYREPAGPYRERPEYRGTALQREHERRYEHDPEKKRREAERQAAEEAAMERWRARQAEHERQMAEYRAEEARKHREAEAEQARKATEARQKALAGERETQARQRAAEQERWRVQYELALQCELAQQRIQLNPQAAAIAAFVEIGQDEAKRIWARHYYGRIPYEPDVTKEGWEEVWAVIAKVSRR